MGVCYQAEVIKANKKQTCRVEWRVVRGTDGRIRRVELTTELRDYWTVLAAYEPGRALGFATRQIGTAASAPADGSWTFVVHPLDGGSSRLLFRGRAMGNLRSFAAAFNVAVFEPARKVHRQKPANAMTTQADDVADEP